MVVWLPENWEGLNPGKANESPLNDAAAYASTLKSAHSERCSLRNRTISEGETF